MPICTLLTDFGHCDWYVGALRGTLLRLAPGAMLVDLSHQVPAGDVEAAALLLGGAAPLYPDGTVHLAVVDPGVGSSRRMLAARCGAQLLVAPDNGLLEPFLDRAQVHAIDRPELYLGAPGQTFHGRDRFAPAAAALLRGETLESLGPRITDPVRPSPAPPRLDREHRRVSGRVIHVDRFGNLITDVPAAWLDGGILRARVGAVVVLRRATHYAELEPGMPALVVGSLGTVEIALRDQSAAAATGVARGAEIVIDLAPPATS